MIVAGPGKSVDCFTSCFIEEASAVSAMPLIIHSNS